MNVLIVEDGALMAQRIAESLATPDVTIVKSCETEDGALEACDRNRIDIAIIDLQLAQGTGFAVIRRLRQVRDGVPAVIVVFTNHAVPALKVAAFEAGADFFLDKAKGISQIANVVDQVRRWKRQEARA